MPAIEACCTRGKAAVLGERVFELSRASEISFESVTGRDSSSGGIGGRKVGKYDAMSVVISATFESLTLRIT